MFSIDWYFNNELRGLSRLSNWYSIRVDILRGSVTMSLTNKERENHGKLYRKHS